MNENEQYNLTFDNLTDQSVRPRVFDLEHDAIVNKRAGEKYIYIAQLIKGGKTIEQFCATHRAFFLQTLQEKEEKLGVEYEIRSCLIGSSFPMFYPRDIIHALP